MNPFTGRLSNKRYALRAKSRVRQLPSKDPYNRHFTSRAIAASRQETLGVYHQVEERPILLPARRKFFAEKIGHVVNAQLALTADVRVMITFACPKRALMRQRFHFRDVGSRSLQACRVERRDEIFFDHEFCRAHINEHGRGFIVRQSAGIDHAARVAGERRGENQYVAGCNEFLVARGGPEFVDGVGLRREPIGGDDLAAIGAEYFGGQATVCRRSR